MNLPEAVAALLNRLEEAGYPAYAVGGCVRDDALGLTPKDYDLCTAARPEAVEALFADCRLNLAGRKHGTIGVLTPEGMVEITTFRTDGAYLDSRHPENVTFVPQVEADLARRDFTVNAMAWSPGRGLADPFGGLEDLRRGVLRTVGDPEERFQEDALRILRGVRFSVRFRLEPEKQTLDGMIRLAPRMEALARERVFDELCKLLPLVQAADLQTFAPILTQVVPELAPAVRFDQHNPHHAYDLYTHIARVTAAVPGTQHLRWAALLHDVGKVPTFTLDSRGRGHFYGHAAVSGEMADGILRRLKAPTALRERVVWLIAQHMTLLEPNRALLRRRLSQYGWERTEELFQLQQADRAGKGVQQPGEAEAFAETAALLEQLRQEDACLTRGDLAINGDDLQKLGYRPGKALGACLEELLRLVTEEALPNTPAALLEQAEKMLKEGAPFPV